MVGKQTVLAMALLLGFSLSAGAAVLRGPYLQRASASEITVCWRSDNVYTGAVHFGTSPTNLSATVYGPGAETNHAVRLTGLLPDSTYWYEIGGGTSGFSGGTDWFFQTLPEPGSTNALRIWVVGDSGKADANAAMVYSSFQQVAGQQYTDLMLMLGDNAYYSGTDAQYQNAMFDLYPEILRQTPCFSCYGNHDGSSADSATQTGPYYDIFTLPANGECGGVPSGTEAYYSFDCGNAHLICLDSYESSRAVGGPMYTWLMQDLAANTSEWLIAYWHHPPYTKGSHDSDTEVELIEMRENFLPLLEQYGVDLVMGGHSHIYERSVLLNGQYGPAASYNAVLHTVNGGDGNVAGDGAYEKALNGSYAGIGSVYMVVGSSGWVSGTSPGYPHPAMLQSQRRLGSVLLEIEGARLTVSFLSTGGFVKDRFTILKQTVPTGDLDGDGLPDEWEQFRFFDPTNAPAGGDADGDGASNLDEYIAGTHPLYSASLFHIESTGENGGVVVRWPSMSGREYELWQAVSIVSNDWNRVAGPLPATPPVNSNTVNQAGNAGYFRVHVRLQP